MIIHTALSAEGLRIVDAQEDVFSLRGLWANGLDAGAALPSLHHSGVLAFPLSQFDIDITAVPFPIRVNKLVEMFWKLQALHMTEPAVGLTEQILGKLAFASCPRLCGASVVDAVKQSGQDALNYEIAKRSYIDKVIDWHLENRPHITS